MEIIAYEGMKNEDGMFSRKTNQKAMALIGTTKYN